MTQDLMTPCIPNLHVRPHTVSIGDRDTLYRYLTERSGIVIYVEYPGMAADRLWFSPVLARTRKLDLPASEYFRDAEGFKVRSDDGYLYRCAPGYKVTNEIRKGRKVVKIAIDVVTLEMEELRGYTDPDTILDEVFKWV